MLLMGAPWDLGSAMVEKATEVEAELPWRRAAAGGVGQGLVMDLAGGRAAWRWR